MTEAPEADYLYGGRKTVMYPDVTSTEQLEEFLLKNQLDYILVGPAIEWFEQYNSVYRPTMRQFLDRLAELNVKNRIERVYYSERELIQVYRVIR